MSKPILFISDLHLEESRQDITASLLSFLHKHSGECECLYILGDLFEVWIGDDESTPLTQTIADALKNFSDNGSQIRVMHGNRDFLIGDDYAKQCGASLITDPYILQHPSGDILLMHGDTLCTDDTAYMQFRDMVRDPGWQGEFLSQSLEARREFARQARAESQKATFNKQSEIMDVNSEAVVAAMESHQQSTLLHGHTHRPHIHDVEVSLDSPAAQKARRVVLGDWDKSGWYAELTANGLELHEFPLSEA